MGSRNEGADWMLGDLGKSKAEKKIRHNVELDIDAVEALMDARDDGKKLRAGIASASSALEELKKCGLTGNALVLLVTAQCRPDKNNNATSSATVQRVLEGLFRLGDNLVR